MERKDNRMLKGAALTLLGGMLWGEYSKVVSGITADDWVAFPYGKSVKEGAPTAEGTWENLYGY